VQKAIRVAFASIPKDSGTFTFYRNLRPQLAKQGIEMFCVSVGKREAELWDKAYADENCVKLAPKSLKIKKQAKHFVKWVRDAKIDIVMGINSRPILSAIEHLPQQVHALARCANGFDHGYKITLSGKPRLERIVALTPKLRQDLITSYGVSANEIELIPNGINPDAYKQARKAKRGAQKVLQLAFIGRLENTQKGVFHIPKILEALKKRDIPFKLSIAGKGRHKSILKDLLEIYLHEGSVEFMGALKADELADFMGTQDILLFTSHFEGCPNTLLEAMMAGMVPVSWLIEGTTDFIIDHQKNGFVHTTKDYAGFAESIASLNDNRALLDNLSKASADKALKYFTNTIAAKAYANLFKEVVAQAKFHEPKSWSEFTPDPNFETGLSDYLPASLVTKIKNFKSAVLKK